MPMKYRIEHDYFIRNQKNIEENWDAKWGDRINELVFIGQDLDREKITADLEFCLIQNEEEKYIGENERFTDPFPQNI